MLVNLLDDPKINEMVNLHVLELQEITGEIKALIDSKIVNITNGTRQRDLQIVKNKLRNFLSSKNDKTRMGAIAEFFTHLYLSTQGYKQECLFFNLEENSIKKGFDGYYSKDGLEWIMESKSGTVLTKGISHKSKIKEAYSDLDKRLQGIKKPSETINNPWENAYNHACHRDVSTKETIVRNIEKLSDDFERGVFKNIKDFNIIPSASIFLNDVWINYNLDKLNREVENLVSELQYQKLEIICFTKKSLNLFMDYLEMD